MPPGHVYFRILGDVPFAIFRVTDPVRRTIPRSPLPGSHIDRSGNMFMPFSFAFASLSAFICYLRFVFRLPFSFPASAALLRLPHSGFSVFLYLVSVFLSAICSSECSYPWRLDLITRCGGSYNRMSLFRIAASSTPFPGLLGWTLWSPFDRLEVCIYDYSGWASVI